VDAFTERATQLLEAAESAALRGEACSEMTILIGDDGAIRLLASSDWPLDSLAWHHGSRAVYRVSGRRGAVRVEGRAGARTCVMESARGAVAAGILRGRL
jgi:hypothetical protein